MQSKTVEILKKGGIGILPTDTIYGLVGSALFIKTVFRIYKLKKRSPRKPFVILISSIDDLNLFGIKIDKGMRKILNRIWPNAVSIVLPCSGKKFFYLHRGNKTLAFRLPRNKNLLRLLQKSGPLVAPSANPERFKPAENIAEAKKYFKKDVDFYIDKGTIKGLASTLIGINGKKINIIRQGAVKIKI